MAKGKFITFEGGEGTGKSTQARLLGARLEEAGRKVVLTREPGGTKGAEFVRDLLKSGAIEPFGTFAEAVAITAARDDHLRQVIEPALARGEWVICDRFSDSTLAYQGGAGGIDAKLLAALDKVAVGTSVPNLTIVLDAPAGQALERARARASEAGEEGDRFEDEDIEYHEKLRAAFLAIARRNRKRCLVFDTSRPADRVSVEIWKAVVKRLKP